MNVKELYLLMEEIFGYKCKMIGINSNKKEATALLYDSFLLKCNLDDQYGRFGAGLIIDNGNVAITEFLGKKCSFNSDEKSIQKSLKEIDDYCRLRLPDKFLEKYNQVYALNSYEQCDL